jgi:geranylgeranyl diphosphate synthase type II
MDDDDFRRGKPTLHKKYSDAIAVLAGDALHALAFELLATVNNQMIVHEVAKAIGITGMLAGQVADVEAEGTDVSRERIEYIHRRKTGALIAVAARLGAILAGADDRQLEIFSAYGSRIGLAFQIVDDVLDITGSQEKLGKDIGSDERNEKATYPRAVGLDESRSIARDLIEEAKAEIVGIGKSSEVLIYLADYIISRDQ